MLDTSMVSGVGEIVYIPVEFTPNLLIQYLSTINSTILVIYKLLQIRRIFIAVAGIFIISVTYTHANKLNNASSERPRTKVKATNFS